MLKLLKSPLSQTPDIMLLTSSLRSQTQIFLFPYGFAEVSNATYVTVYFTPEQAKTSRHPLQLKTQGFFFTAHPPGDQYQLKPAFAVSRTTAFHLASISASRRYCPFNGACPSSLFSRAEKIHDRHLEDQLMSWSLC